ncbi:hypothetical protein OS493_021440 [Desmophyllum pertusum]|uniref:Uncharacterized protein n=1 Tax=Desmophyllum pertusum TaxID=174260 RepID=A0A9X0CQ74_9CNID|nr:hypothetical protein OS493_021440 [Desmophyllum pertusum]
MQTSTVPGLPSLPKRNSVIPAPPATSSNDITRLSLQKETESLQIQHVQLELQLAQLKLGNKHSQIRQSARQESDKAGDKSLGDLKAPHKTGHSTEMATSSCQCNVNALLH